MTEMAVSSPCTEPRLDEPVTRSVRAIGTTAVLSISEPAHLVVGEQILRDELDAIDLACSRFRADSELACLNDEVGGPRRVSALLFDAISVAVEVAELTNGAVDPTVGRALEALGYDRDFEQVISGDLFLEHRAQSAAGWRSIELDSRTRSVRLPAGVRLDLGSSAKALVSDRAARRIAEHFACGVLVSVGGDVAVAGEAPEGGWAIGISADSATSTDSVDQVVSIAGGGLASSSTTVRTWRRGTRQIHHIVDPHTGEPAEPYWSLVSATGRSCVEANAASTAAIVWGRGAPRRLGAMGSPARLVRHDGRVLCVNGWPVDAPDLACSDMGAI
jgi:thiamine biosynthesis lipoprotein